MSEPPLYQSVAFIVLSQLVLTAAVLFVPVPFWANANGTGLH